MSTRNITGGVDFDNLDIDRLPTVREDRVGSALISRSPSKGNLKRLTQLFAQSGNQVIIEGEFYCDYGDKITLGDRIYINANCTILDGGLVNIGHDCMFGPNVQLLTVSHDVDRIGRKKSIHD